MVALSMKASAKNKLKTDIFLFMLSVLLILIKTDWSKLDITFIWILNHDYTKGIYF